MVNECFEISQVNLEYLARVVFNRNGYLYPDTLVGTDSHTTMIDGLGVAGWGVGGIEAEAAMLGQVSAFRVYYWCDNTRHVREQPDCD